MTHTLKVGCYGAKGSYTYEAMEQQFDSKEREESYFPLFEDVVKAVKDGTIDYGVLPIENSSTGGITEVYDLIQKYDCAVVGEQLVKIEHNLLGIPGATLDDIDTVYSHPQGFRQCRPFFNEHRDWTLEPYFSTSRSAERVAEDGRKNSVKHEPGALYHVLGYFFYGGMNMTHLESRPMEGHPFEYFFHIDVKGRIHDPSNAQTLHGLASMCTYFKILGNYPSCKK